MLTTVAILSEKTALGTKFLAEIWCRAKLMFQTPLAELYFLISSISRCLAAEALFVHAALPASAALATALRASTKDAIAVTRAHATLANASETASAEAVCWKISGPRLVWNTYCMRGNEIMCTENRWKVAGTGIFEDMNLLSCPRILVINIGGLSILLT
ncbi:hypothetical protein AXG93_2062s1030 [Marchantia polymorpha subsp. ruderalis]|uniref:Uncharacterized protein n=1 Tax=Marchantia polymorpha subsp. ruderalis TaxID=1480154 RepID=A0A176VFD5_MARPO|nr:hypothetical protein AXG93_2062s1030 [Marchantia polymorpha subsp. ruderalis]